MKIKLLTATVLLAAASAIAPTLVRAQDPPAETYQPGFWQPVARYNPSRLVEVRLVNRSGYTLLYDLTSDEVAPRRLTPGASTVLTNIRPDSYISLYSDDASQAVGLPVRYNVSASDNVVTNVVSRSTTGISEQTMHLHPNGGIYIY